MNKQALRKSLREQRNQLPMQTRIEASSKITENAMWLANDVNRIGTYLSFSFEVDTIDSISSWLLEGKEIFVPRMLKDDFEWVHLKDFKSLKTNQFGVSEPSEGDIVDISTLDIVFVPLLGFDDALHRIGYGKGCFDRALKNYAGKKIGLCYAMGYVETIYPTENDVPLDIVITEKEIVSKHR